MWRRSSYLMGGALVALALAISATAWAQLRGGRGGGGGGSGGGNPSGGSGNFSGGSSIGNAPRFSAPSGGFNFSGGSTFSKGSTMHTPPSFGSGATGNTPKQILSNPGSGFNQVPNAGNRLQNYTSPWKPNWSNNPPWNSNLQNRTPQQFLDRNRDGISAGKVWGNDFAARQKNWTNKDWQDHHDWHHGDWKHDDWRQSWWNRYGWSPTVGWGRWNWWNYGGWYSPFWGVGWGYPGTGYLYPEYTWSYGTPYTAAYPGTVVTAAPATDFGTLQPAVDAFQRGDYRGAVALAQQVLATEPQNAGAFQLIGLANFALGDYAAAARAVRSGLQFGPPIDWPQIYRFYGNDQTYTAQLRTLEQFAANHPSLADSQFLLGYHYGATGNRQQATDFLQRAQQLDPGDPMAGRLLEMLRGPQQPNG